MIASRLRAEVPATVTAEPDDPAAGLDDRVWRPRIDDEGCVLPTFQAISRYLETVVPGAVCVLYTHAAGEARLVASHVSSPEREFLLRDLSMPLGDRLTGWVGANRQTIVNSDPALDLGTMAEAWNPRLRSCFAIPIVWDDTLLGVLSIHSRPAGARQPAETDVTLLASEGLESMSMASSTLSPRRRRRRDRVRCRSSIQEPSRSPPDAANSLAGRCPTSAAAQASGARRTLAVRAPRSMRRLGRHTALDLTAGRGVVGPPWQRLHRADGYDGSVHAELPTGNHREPDGQS